MIMQYQNIINLLDYTTNQPSKFRTRNWVEINDKLKGKSDNSNIRFKTSHNNLFDYSNAYILLKGTITVPNMTAAGAPVNNTSKKLLLQSYAPFIDCTTQLNNTQVDEAQKIYIVMPMYNLIEYSDLTRGHQEAYGNTVEMKQL